MLARGLQTKQVARALGISVKTADRHIQNAYRKIGVSTRAAATLFAMEHGLVAWGELPIGAAAASALASVSARRPPSGGQAKEDGMATETIERSGGTTVTTSPRRSRPPGRAARAEVEEFSAPVRQWMLRELAPQAGDTLLELAAGSATLASRRPRSSARAAA